MSPLVCTINVIGESASRKSAKKEKVQVEKVQVYLNSKFWHSMPKYRLWLTRLVMSFHLKNCGDWPFPLRTQIPVGGNRFYVVVCKQKHLWWLSFTFCQLICLHFKPVWASRKTSFSNPWATPQQEPLWLNNCLCHLFTFCQLFLYFTNQFQNWFLFTLLKQLQIQLFSPKNNPPLTGNLVVYNKPPLPFVYILSAVSLLYKLVSKLVFVYIAAAKFAFLTKKQPPPNRKPCGL